MGHALPHHDCKVSVIILKLKSTGSIFHSHNLSPLIFYRAQNIGHLSNTYLLAAKPSPTIQNPHKRKNPRSSSEEKATRKHPSGR